jgi:hypothetical protein
MDDVEHASDVEWKLGCTLERLLRVRREVQADDDIAEPCPLLRGPCRICRWADLRNGCLGRSRRNGVRSSRSHELREVHDAYPNEATTGRFEVVRDLQDRRTPRAPTAAVSILNNLSSCIPAHSASSDSIS